MYNVAHFKRCNSRGRAKMEWSISIVMHVMLVFIYLKSMQLVTIKVKKSTGALGLSMLHTGFSL